MKESGDLPRSYSKLMQIYMDRTAKSLNSNALVAHRVHAVCLGSTEER